MKKFSSIVITGASSGIGAALAEHYAAPEVMLFLCGRNKERLEAVANHCRARGAGVMPKIVDVCDQIAMQQWLLACDALKPVELVIANAGVSGGTGGAGIHGETAEQTHGIFAANVGGVINTALPLIPAMIERGHGQIAIMASLASFRGLPSAPAYSASKSAARAWGEALRGYLGRHGIGVSVICPGYIRTRMTDANPFPMPFIMNAGKAAKIMARGIAGNKARVAFPLALYAPMWLLGSLPPCLTDWFFARLPAKPANVGEKK